MSSAVISLSGKQFRVSEGQTLTTDRLALTEGDTLVVSDVLLLTDAAGKVHVGAPLVAGATVTLKADLHKKGTKIRVATYQSKKRRRTVKGHRQLQTVLTVVSIATGTKAKAEKAEAPVEVAEKPAKAPATKKAAPKKPAAK